MTLVWSDLTWPQINLINRIERPARYAGKRIEEDHPGMEIGDLRETEIWPMRQLVQMGLLQIDIGWRKTVWLRLTEKGLAIWGESRG